MFDTKSGVTPPRDGHEFPTSINTHWHSRSAIKYIIAKSGVTPPRDGHDFPNLVHIQNFPDNRHCFERKVIARRVLSNPITWGVSY